MQLLRAAWDKVLAAGWRLGNLDCIVVCDTPKVLPHRAAIIASLAKTLGADPSQIFVKGKTAEGLGPIGEGLAVEAYATALLVR
jgi:2-C-methyl-D-erythritol 2,4-cyclodiphosphate synthase/2-C-methyl-D-erythritol 4-phosphate cytidylyltransferase/2-C-methyl-D-erythritol 2,4-cyclodiphosphate synthase